MKTRLKESIIFLDTESMLISLKTIYTNFKYFPISDALKFPIVIGKNTDIKLGSIKFNCPIKPSLVRLGTQPIPVIEDGFSRLVVKNSGTIEIGGLFYMPNGGKNIN